MRSTAGPRWRMMTVLCPASLALFFFLLFFLCNVKLNRRSPCPNKEQETVCCQPARLGFFVHAWIRRLIMIALVLCRYPQVHGTSLYEGSFNGSMEMGDICKFSSRSFYPLLHSNEVQEGIKVWVGRAGLANVCRRCANLGMHGRMYSKVTSC